MEFKREIIIDRPINEVWEVLGNQFGDAYKWASGLMHSEALGAPKIEGAFCNNRACEVKGFGKIKEVIRKFDAKNYVLQYEVIEGFPGFVKQAINTWSLSQNGKQTKLNMHLEMETKGFMGTIMKPMMKMQMGSLTTTIIKDFKHYVETGKPSSNKAKEMAKAAA